MEASRSNLINLSNEIVVFKVGTIVCGLMTKDIQEINKNLDITPVYGAPTYVRGVINLRGEIVTIVDMRAKFGLKHKDIDHKTRNVIVNFHDEQIGLLVDEVYDIIMTDKEELMAPPSNLKGAIENFFIGIYMIEKELVSILDIENVLRR